MMMLPESSQTETQRSWPKTIKKKENSTQHNTNLKRARAYEVTSFRSTDCELSTETCSKNVYSPGVTNLVCKRIEFVLANHRTRNAHVINGNACRDTTGQSEFFVCVSRLNFFYCYIES